MTDTQKVILSIFKEISAICKRHEIPYFAIGGTCIGAVRHKGFIPWDDDIDIAVPIEYFDKLLGYLRNEVPDNLYLFTSRDKMHYHYIWAKLCDKNTTFIEKSEYAYEDAYKGVFVDIMPISGIPEGCQRKSFYRKLKRYNLCNDIRRFPIEKSTRNIFNTYFKNILKGLFSLLPYTFFSDKYLHYLEKFPFYQSSYTGYVWYSIDVEKLTFPQSYMNEAIEMPFEDTVISVPKQYDSYLSFQFGDYMRLPPVEQRMIHNGLVDLKHPFAYYYGKLKELSIKLA